MTRRREVDWREVVAANVDALPKRRSTIPEDATKVTVDFRGGVHGFLLEAARSRGLSLAAYVRRAALAVAAHDVGVATAALTGLDPRVSRETGFSVSDPGATMFGPWQIEGMRDCGS